MERDQSDSGAPMWPITIFEADGWPVVVRTAAELPEVYEDDYWDEVADAFDAERRHISVQFLDGRPVARRAMEAADSSFARWARSALDRFDHRGPIRWHAAAPDRHREIEQLTDEELWRELLERFGRR